MHTARRKQTQALLRSHDQLYHGQQMKHETDVHGSPQSHDLSPHLNDHLETSHEDAALHS